MLAASASISMYMHIDEISIGAEPVADNSSLCVVRMSRKHMVGRVDRCGQ